MSKKEYRLIYVTGGARSGKSHFAETLITDNFQEEQVIYLATAGVFDAEMQMRVAHHQERRPDHWRTIEAEKDLEPACRSILESSSALLLDCVTLLVSNTLLAEDQDDFDPWLIEQKVVQDLKNLLNSCKSKGQYVVIVSNEVGLGIVPEYKLGRIFRDIAGRVNQWLAQEADQVYLLVSGLPLKLKG